MARAVLAYARYAFIRQTVAGVGRPKLLILEAGQTCGCADPKLALFVFVQKLDLAAADFMGIFGIEHLEAHSVKANQSLFGCHPEITVVSLEYGVNGVVWQALFSLPNIMPVLTQQTRRVKGKYKTR
jgi:hypothetical protein